MSGIAKREPHRWLPGQSGNPAGRPVGSRQKLAEQYLRDLYEFWQEIGPAADVHVLLDFYCNLVFVHGCVGFLKTRMDAHMVRQ